MPKIKLKGKLHIELIVIVGDTVSAILRVAQISSHLLWYNVKLSYHIIILYNIEKYTYSSWVSIELVYSLLKW